jgi:hypothetical protein
MRWIILCSILAQITALPFHCSSETHLPAADMIFRSAQHFSLDWKIKKSLSANCIISLMTEVDHTEYRDRQIN